MSHKSFLKVGLFTCFISSVLGWHLVDENVQHRRHLRDDQIETLTRISLVGPYRSMPTDQAIKSILKDVYNPFDADINLQQALPKLLTDTEMEILEKGPTEVESRDRAFDITWEFLKASPWDLKAYYQWLEWCLGGFVFGIVGAYTAKLFWYFSLERLREIAQAIRSSSPR